MDWRTGFVGEVIQQDWGRERSSFCGREGLYSWGKVWHLYSVGREVGGHELECRGGAGEGEGGRRGLHLAGLCGVSALTKKHCPVAYSPHPPEVQQMS